MDVYFYEAFAEEAEVLRRLLGESLRYEATPQTVQETGHLDPPSRLISIRTQSQVPVAWADRIDGLLSRSTGFDHLVAYRAAVGRPVPCGFLDEYATRAVAEHAITALLVLFRRLPRQVEQFERFDRDGLTGAEFGGKRLLVVGVGRIGREVVRLGRGLGMSVLGVDVVRRHSDVDYIEAAEGMGWAEAVVCAMNLTEENRGYFHEALFRQAKPGLLFVNIARGDHARTDDLVRLVREGQLGGVALDVYEQEEVVAGALRSGSGSGAEALLRLRALREQSNVILTPHNAFNTVEAVERKSEYTVRQIRHFLRRGEFLWHL